MADIQEMIDSARQKVRDYLTEIDPDFQEYDSGMFTVQEGSAVIGISFRPWHIEDVAVEFTSQLVNDASLSEESMRWLLEKNAALHFGSFGLLFDGSIIYSHTIPAACLNQQTFDATLRTVAAIADHYDDEIVQIAGGILSSAAPGSAESEVAQQS